MIEELLKQLVRWGKKQNGTGPGRPAPGQPLIKVGTNSDGTDKRKKEGKYF